MTGALQFFLAIALVGCLGLAIMWWLAHAASRKARRAAETQRAAAEANRRILEDERADLRGQVARLAKWTAVADADEKARELLASAETMRARAEYEAGVLTSNADHHYTDRIEEARADAAAMVAEGRAKAKLLIDETQGALETASKQAAQIIAEADRRAEQIAGEAYDAVRNAAMYERTAKAMRNVIEGYGDEYLMPADSLLDDLADDFSHKDAGQQLKIARDRTRAIVKAGTASSCLYVEENRRKGAEHFVLDAFNGKDDSILSRVKHDNVGVLNQEITDAFTLVNYGGKAFRDARITDEYLAARLQELRWASTAQELKRQEQEEQRLIREQIREEEKARREFERVIRETEKEEDVLRKAMARAEAQIALATEGQRAKFEAQLADLNAKLLVAEERNQRALSMAQQTRRGHVYIISNVGSFGGNIYKIGLTRRLEPLDRIDELGDSSVPFDFDVHAMIMSEDAPKLENQLHKHFLINQVNKVNHRREFFRASIADIRREIEALGLEAKWTMTSDAMEFRETQAIERAIESDPAAREAWLKRQLTLDPTDYRELALAD